MDSNLVGDQATGVEKLSFDEIIRNLLAFLKGQVFSLQSKRSQEDVIHQIQTIVYMLRTSTIQLESAAKVDRTQTNEYQAALQELESLKKTSSKLEESLLIEMDKSQKLVADLESQSSIIRQREQYITELEEKISQLQQELEQLKIRSSIDSSLLEKANATEKAFEQVKAENAKLHEAIAAFRNKFKQTIKTIRQKRTQERQAWNAEREVFLSEITKLKNEQEERLKTPIVETSSETDLITIKNLQEQIEKLQEALQNAVSQNSIQNVQKQKEPNINNLEKASNEQLNALIAENKELHQQVLDLEAAVRSLSTIKSKSLNETPVASSLRTEEVLLFFDILTTLISRLANSPENRDLRQKAEQSLALWEKTHAIDAIPALGTIYNEKLHKVVRSYFAPFLEDGLIIKEVTRGYRSGERIIQQSVVWIAKSHFRCTECGFTARPQDNFCPKCGLELVAPDGTTKRKLTILPTDPEIGIPLLDVLLNRNQTQAAQALLSHLSAADPDNQALKNRRQLIAQSTGAQSTK